MKKLTLTFLFIICILGQQSLSAQTLKGENGTKMTLKPFEATTKNQQKIIQLSTHQSTPFVPSKHLYFLVAFEDILNTASEKILQQSKANYIGYLGDNIYLLSSNDMNKSIAYLNKKLPQNNQIIAVDKVPAAFKLKKELLQALQSNQQLTTSNYPDGILVHVYNTKDLKPLKETLTQWQVSYTEDSTSAYSLIINTLNPTILKAIATIPYVSNIEKQILPQSEAVFFNMSWMMNPNQIAMVNYDRKGYIGNGAYFGNWETYGYTKDFQMSYHGREIKNYIDRTNNGHGTNVAQIVGSANNIHEYESGGMAPGVKILAMNDNSQYGFTGGVRPLISKGYSPLVSNHSVGWGVGNVGYNAASRELDKATYENPSYLSCYSAGNSGGSGEKHNDMIFPDYQSLTGDIKTNKNNLTVHSNANVGDDVAFASFGPTQDGRIKPDICAEGSGGTSFASPGAAGMVAVLYEAYIANYGKPVRSDVVKAVMLNTAIDMGSKGIDFRTGYGQINPRRAVEIFDSKNSIAKDYIMPQGREGEITHEINVPEGIGEAKFMLYWHDYPGTTGSATNLVNDLDLEVIQPDGTTILPYVLDARPQYVKRLPTQQRDSLNNVEQVVIENPQVGNYTIRVKGHRVVRGIQKFVLTWDIKPAGIRINSFPEGYKISKEADCLVSWDYAGDIRNKNIKVYYRHNDKSQWVDVANVNGKYYHKWGYKALPTFIKNMPITSTAQFKVVCDNVESLSGHIQYMPQPQKLKITEFCKNKITLSWDKLPNFEGKYLIYRLGEKYMEPIDSIASSDNSYTLIAKEGESFSEKDYFAIAARDKSTNALSMRTIPVTIDQFTDITNQSTYYKNYTLCYGDIIRFGADDLKGDITWYKDGKIIPTHDRKLNISVNNLGTYQYKISNDGCDFTSQKINFALGGVEITDTTQVGNFLWKGYIFKGGDDKKIPMYGEDAHYYANFTLNKLNFDSNEDLFSWKKNHNEIPGYQGCPVPNKWNTVVMKRKGFTQGKYNIRLSRASRRMKITIIDTKNNKVLLNYKSAFDFNNPNMYLKRNLPMDENTEIRLEWFGDHLVIAFDKQDGNTPIAYAPGGVKDKLSVWVKANSATTDNKSNVLFAKNEIPQNTIISPESNTANIKLNPAGLNYQATFEFDKSGGLFGTNDTPYKGNSVSDFVVFKLERNQPKSWARVLSFGKNNTPDWDNVGSYITIERFADNNSIGTMRNEEQLLSSGAYMGYWHLLQVQYDKANVTISNRGRNTGKKIFPSNNFDIDSYMIGANLDREDDVRMVGQVAEIIHYERALTTNEQHRINTYLSLKYGLNYPNGDYLNSNEEVIYQRDKTFKYSIAGLVCDSTQNLIVKQSKQEDYKDILIGSIGEIANTQAENNSQFDKDNTYIIWGHNNKSIALDKQQQTMSRIWMIQATHNTQHIRLNFEKNSIKTTEKDSANLYIVTSQEPELTNEITYKINTYTAENGNTYYFADIPISKGNSYFTIGLRSDASGISTLLEKSQIQYNKKQKNIYIKSTNLIKQIELISTAGWVVQSLSTNEKEIDIATNNLPNGAYILRMTDTQGNHYNQKLIIW